MGDVTGGLKLTLQEDVSSIPAAPRRERPIGADGATPTDGTAHAEPPTV